MIRFQYTSLVIFTEGLYSGNGSVNKWCIKITARFTREAKRAAPRRTGELAALISGDSSRAGLHQVSGTISSFAPHTIFVLYGTRDRGSPPTPYGVTPVTAPYMVIPAYGGYPRLRRTEVHGQHPQNFLLKAWARTARDHSSIRSSRLIGGLSDWF
jgi:hypothetical protein